MYTALLGLVLFASYLLYNTSSKVKFVRRADWLASIAISHPKILKNTAISLLALTLVICCLLHGVGAGITAWLIYLMGMLSLVVLLNPYRYLKAEHLGGILLLSFALELLFT